MYKRIKLLSIIALAFLALSIEALQDNGGKDLPPIENPIQNIIDTNNTSHDS